MKDFRLFNAAYGGVTKSIRSCYGKCGMISFFLSTGHGITGVAEIYEDIQLRRKA